MTDERPAFKSAQSQVTGRPVIRKGVDELLVVWAPGKPSRFRVHQGGEVFVSMLSVSQQHPHGYEYVSQATSSLPKFNELISGVDNLPLAGGRGSIDSLSGAASF